MWRRVLGLLCVASCLLFVLTVLGVEPSQEFTCEEGGGGPGPGTPPPPERTCICDPPSTLGPVVETRVVCITYDGTDSVMMQSAEWLKADLEDFFNHISNGKQRHHVKFLKRLDDSTLAWRARYSPAWGSLDAIHKQVFGDIYNAYQGVDSVSVWRGVEEVVAIHYRCLSNFSCPVGYGQLSSSFGYALRDGMADSLEFEANGATLVLGDINEVSADSLPRLSWGIAHELGHAMCMEDSCGYVGHSPNSESGCGHVTKVNMGNYDVMTAFGTTWASQVTAPVMYHPWWVQRLGWVECDTIDADTLGLRIPDLRDSANAKIFWINVPAASQTLPLRQHFMMVNLQETGRDVRLGNSGLLFWHFLEDRGTSGAAWDSTAWDLESAAGKFRYEGGNRIADPVAGLDSLEREGCFEGSGADFFDGVADTVFSAITNPNTNLYDSTYAGTQSVVSSISFENIRQDGSDMLVDVYVTPTQTVTYPDGGETIAAGSSFTVTWQVRAQASVDSVDILLSSNGGQAFQTTLAKGVSNTGSRSVTSTTLGSQCRIRILSYNGSAVVGSDDSDANFTLAVVQQSSVSHSNLSVPVDSILVNINWSTLVETSSSNDHVRFYRLQNGGSPISPSAVTYTVNGTSHTAAVVITPCDAEYWYYEVKSVNNGVTHWSTRTSSMKFRVNACVTP